MEGNEASAGGGVHLAQATTATIGGDVVFDTNVALRCVLRSCDSSWFVGSSRVRVCVCACVRVCFVRLYV